MFATNSQFVLAVVLVGASLSLGYHLGARSVCSARPRTFEPAVPKVSEHEKESIEHNNDSEEEDEEWADGDLSTVKAAFMEPCKLVLVVRTDLNMTSGKISAQCGHATLACYKALVQKNPQLVQHWERTGQAKIALKATSEEQLLELEAIAKSLNLCARSIQDQGRTQVAEGSRTVLGIGPAPVDLVNQVTGKLRLL